MVGTLAVVGLMLVVLTLPNYPGDHRQDLFPLPVLSLSLAGLMVVALPLALVHRQGFPTHAGLWLPVGAYVCLLVMEPFTLRAPLQAGSTPWLLGLSLIAFSCTAVAEANPARAVMICGGIDAALACVYAGRIPLSHTLVISSASACLRSRLSLACELFEFALTGPMKTSSRRSCSSRISNAR